MKSKMWLLISGVLLISAHLLADDRDYSNRQFNVNPGNMVDGMFNPMRGFFGGSNRYSDDYYNRRYAPPPAYQPGYGYGYGYPGAPYGYPPVNPGYQPLPQTGGYPTNIPPQHPPAATAGAQPHQTPASSSYTPAPSAQPGYSEHFRFRPLDTAEQPVGGTETSPPSARQPAAPPSYPATQQPSGRDIGTQTLKQGYGTDGQIPSGSQTGQLKFRPLDQPGYSE
jgi:hypothetical protein